ncbi:sensor histidine kinase [Aestuariispira insulae]|uniref:histidine kinase n=1 Tax=Aestuariispira insulae TaxID=1461337 RepID=A0A3D9HWQ7_9PROT|nr:ATP-binding protein [Aestuariispira insulae]RED53938.1 signal transduction histidine kinase [Aestuariispira insulae]
MTDKGRSITITLLKRLSLIALAVLVIISAIMLHEYQEILDGSEGADRIADELMIEFIEEFGWVMVATIAAGFGVIILTVRSSLKPLMAVSEEAEKLGPENMDQRLSTNGVPREIRPLVDRVNEALDRMEAGYKQQKAFTADVAHELRTPLAVLRARFEADIDPRAAEPFIHDLDSLDRLIGQMLKASQVETLILHENDQTDLSAIAARVVTDMAVLAIAEGKSVELIGAENPMIVPGLEEALYQAVRNLVENALRHSPAAGVVSVILRENGQPVIEVQDRGEGLAAGIEDKLFQRFWRKDRMGGSGAGLGLSIVARIMELHGGRASAKNAAEGGAVFTLTFPPSPAAS